MPEISVIVPVYNTEKYLHRCIDSILAQTFTDLELLLVDDGSTDTSGAICDDYAKKDCRVHVFHQTNQGQAAARNFALDWMFANSNSDFVSFIDSDDWVHPQFFELSLLAARKGFRIVSCGILIFSKDEEISINYYSLSYEQISPEFVYTQGEKKIYTYICGKLYDKGLWEKLRFPVGIRWEDLAIFHKLVFAVTKIAYIRDKMYFYYRNPEGTVFSSWGTWKNDYIHVLQKLLTDPIILQHPDVLEALKHTFVRSLESRISFLEKKKSDCNYNYLDALRFHRKRLRHFLADYHNEYPFLENRHLFEAAFPRIMWLYWTLVGLIKKVKRMVRRHADD